jgi:cell division protein FtsA
MDNKNDIIVGLDIGTTKIACFIGQRGDDGKVNILGYGKTESIGVERGVVMNIKSTSESIVKAVTMASEKANVDVAEVYVGIAGQHIKSRQNLGGIMIPSDHEYIKEEDINNLINTQRQIMLSPGEEIIHIFPQTFYVDNEELSSEIPPVGVAGKELKANFLIVTGNTANLRNIADSVKRAKLSVKDVVLEPIASSYAVLDETSKTAGAALVDIGGGTTDIAIFHEGVIRHTSVLPLAGNAITNDIKEGCSIMKPQAEALKTRFGCCLPQNVNENDIISIPGIHYMPSREISMKTLAGIIKARTVTILEQVAFEIEQSGYAKQLIGGVVLTGGGAKLKNIKELTEYTTSTNTRIGLPNEHLDKNSAKEIIDPMYATGIGLVLYGIEQSEMAKRERPAEPDPEMLQRQKETEEFIRKQQEEVKRQKGSETLEHKTTEKHPAGDSTKGRSKNGGWVDAVSGYFKRVFTEENIDSDNDD